MRFVDRASVLRLLLVGLVVSQLQFSAAMGQGYGSALQRFVPQSNGYNGARYGSSDFNEGRYGVDPYQKFEQWQGADTGAAYRRLTPQAPPPMGYRFRSQPDIPAVADTQLRFRPLPMNGRSPYGWGRGTGGYEGALAPLPIFRPLGDGELRAKQYREQLQGPGEIFPFPSAETSGGFQNRGDFRGTAGYRPEWGR